MIYKEGLADRFGSPIAPYPFLHKNHQSWVVRFNPEYQWLTGDDIEDAKAKELGDTKGNLDCLKEQILEVLPRLSKVKQEILTLMLVYGKHPSDIATILGCSYANIHIHLYGDRRYRRSGAVAQLKQIVKTKGV